MLLVTLIQYITLLINSIKMSLMSSQEKLNPQEVVKNLINSFQCKKLFPYLETLPKDFYSRPIFKKGRTSKNIIFYL